jgi:hypothetical protein
MSPKRQKRGTTDGSRPPIHFQFINISDDLKIEEQDKDTIRSQAISDYHRRKRENDPIRPVAESSTHTTAISPLRVNRFRLQKLQNSPSSAETVESSVLDADPAQANLALEAQSSSYPQASTSIGKKRAETSVTTYSQPSGTHTAEANELIRRLDLLAGEIEPLLCLPVGSSDELRQFVHHYCKLNLQIFNPSQKRKLIESRSQ